MSVRDWLWLVFLGGIWGSSFLFNGILIREIEPLWVAAGRVGVGALGCWVAFFVLGKSLPKRKMLYLHFFVLGVLNYTIPFALYPLSQQSLPSGVAAIINGMTPIMTVIVSHFWLGGERATWNKSIGVVFGFAGVAILSSPALIGGGSSEIWAIGACLLATVCYAVALNYTRSIGKIDPTVMATCALTGASVAAIPVAYIAHGAPQLETYSGWGALMGIGLLATTLAFLLMYRVLPRVGATNFSIVTFIAPISAIILGAAILKEAVLPVHLAGMTGIFIGLLLLDGRILKIFRKQPA